MVKTLKYGLKVLQIYFRANGGWAIVDIFGQLYTNTLYPFIQVYLLAKLLDVLSGSSVVIISHLSWMFTFFVASSLIKIILSNFHGTRGAVLDFNTANYIDLAVYRKLATLDPAVFENPDFQKILAQMDGIKGGMGSYYLRIVAVIDSLFKFATGTIVVSTAFPLFAPLIALATLPSFLALNQYRNKLWPYFSSKYAILQRLSQYIKTLLSSDSASKETAIFQNSNQLIAKFRQHQSIYIRNFSRANDAEMIKIIIAEISQLAAFVYTQWLNLAQVLVHKLTIGQFTLYFQQTLNLSFGAMGALDNYSSLKMRSKFIDTYFEFMDTKRAIISPAFPVGIPSQPKPPLIEFKDVSFKYPKSDREILKHFNLKVTSGEKVALVGENGAGKTTIIKLLLRFYDVTGGELLVNGVNIKKLNLDDWYKYIGVLFQDFIKYQFTFKENIIFGSLEKKDDAKILKEAIQKSGAEDYLKNLPKGVEQVVGKMFEEGVDLSGGQWQKLALARAFFRNAPILILDEPTSAIDAKSESEIFEKVQKFQADKTVIIISHRFSTVRNADRILVLEEGWIIEEGNHDTLIKRKGLYAELFNIQAKGYK